MLGVRVKAILMMSGLLSIWDRIPETVFNLMNIHYLNQFVDPIVKAHKCMTYLTSVEFKLQRKMELSGSVTELHSHTY